MRPLYVCHAPSTESGFWLAGCIAKVIEIFDHPVAFVPKFALERLKGFKQDSVPFIMLEYSDNFQWVNATVKPKIESRYPFAEILLQPLSLTSGAHMGPGTWGIAFLPETI